MKPAIKAHYKAALKDAKDIATESGYPASLPESAPVVAALLTLMGRNKYYLEHELAANDKDVQFTGAK